MGRRSICRNKSSRMARIVPWDTYTMMRLYSSVHSTPNRKTQPIFSSAASSGPKSDAPPSPI